MTEEYINKYKFELKDYKINLMENLKSSIVKQKIDYELTKINQNIQEHLDEQKSNSAYDNEFENIKVYQEALSFLDKKYHMFEHNFFPNINKYFI